MSAPSPEITEKLCHRGEFEDRLGGQVDVVEIPSAIFREPQNLRLPAQYFPHIST